MISPSQPPAQTHHTTLSARANAPNHFLALIGAHSQLAKSKLWGNQRILIGLLEDLSWLPADALLEYHTAQRRHDIAAMSDILARTKAEKISVYRTALWECFCPWRAFCRHYSHQLHALSSLMSQTNHRHQNLAPLENNICQGTLRM